MALVVLPALIAVVLSRWLGADRRLVWAAALAGMLGHLVGDVIGLWPVPLLYPFSTEKTAFFLLEKDFSLELDLVLVSGAVVTFWDPVAERLGRLRAVVALVAVVAAVTVALV